MASSANEPSEKSAVPARGSAPGRPTWVKVFAVSIALLVLVVVVVMALAGGEHGPGRHVPGGDSGVHTPPVQHDS